MKWIKVSRGSSDYSRLSNHLRPIVAWREHTWVPSFAPSVWENSPESTKVTSKKHKMLAPISSFLHANMNDIDVNQSYRPWT